MVIFQPVMLLFSGGKVTTHCQVQDPAALEFETYKFNLAWTKMKQVVGGGSGSCRWKKVNYIMMVETPRNGPNHQTNQKTTKMKLDFKNNQTWLFLEWVLWVCVIVWGRDTSLLSFRSEKHMNPFSCSDFYQQRGGWLSPGYPQTREPAALGWDSTALPRGGMKKLQSPNESLSRCWWVSSDGLENRHCCKTQNIQFSVFKWSILWPSRIRCWVSSFKIFPALDGKNILFSPGFLAGWGGEVPRTSTAT